MNITNLFLATITATTLSTEPINNDNVDADTILIEEQVDFIDSSHNEITEINLIEENLDEFSGSDKTVITAQDVCDTSEVIVESFLNSIAKTENFAVYAENYNTNTHIDGNIAVKNLESDLEDIKPHYIINQEDRYSYIENTNGNEIRIIEDDMVLITGDNTIVGNKNGNSAHIVIDTKAEDYKENLIEQMEGINNKVEIDIERFDQEIKITENLETIALNGDKLAQVSGEVLDSKQATEALKQICAEMNNGVYIMYISPETINDRDFCNAVEQFFRDNKNIGAKLVISVNTENVEEINFNQPQNPPYGTYSENYNNLLWNFGSFAGTITTTQHTLGSFIAALATLNIFGPKESNVVANTVNQTMEIHHQTIESPVISLIPPVIKPDDPTLPEKENPTLPGEEEENPVLSEEPEQPEEDEKVEDSEESEQPEEDIETDTSEEDEELDDEESEDEILIGGMGSAESIEEETITESKEEVINEENHTNNYIDNSSSSFKTQPTMSKTLPATSLETNIVKYLWAVGGAATAGVVLTFVKKYLKNKKK